MHPRLTELLTHLDDERARVLAAASRLPPDRWTIRPEPSRWSVAQVCWHLQRVESGVAKLIRKRTTEARAQGHPAEQLTTTTLHSLDGRRLTDRSVSLSAPSQVSPPDDVDAETVQRQLAESRAMLRDAMAEADGLALGSITHLHPVLGEIDLYQWILFVAQHDERHRAQIVETAQAVADR